MASTISKYFEKKNNHSYSDAYEQLAKNKFYSKKHIAYMMDRVDEVRTQLNSYQTVEEQIQYLNLRRQNKSEREFDEQVFGISQDDEFNIQDHMEEALKKTKRHAGGNILTPEDKYSQTANKYLTPDGNMANAFYNGKKPKKVMLIRKDDSAGKWLDNHTRENGSPGDYSHGNATPGTMKAQEEGVIKTSSTDDKTTTNGSGKANGNESKENGGNDSFFTSPILFGGTRNIGAKYRRRKQRGGNDAIGGKQKLKDKLSQRARYAHENVADEIAERIGSLTQKFAQIFKFILFIWKPITVILILWQILGLIIAIF